MRIVVSIVVLLGLAYAALAWLFGTADHSQYDEPSGELIIRPEEVSKAHEDVVAKLVQFREDGSTDIHVARQQMEALLYQPIELEPIPADVDGVAGEWLFPEEADPSRRLLYLHGGAFRVGSPKSHRYVTSEIAERTGIAVLAIDYRLLPEATIPETLEDVRKSYRWILENGPSGPAPVRDLLIAGDSAGGTLTLSTIAWARDEGLKPARAALAMSPGTDYTMSAPSWQSNIQSDPFIGPALGALTNLPSPLRALILRMQMGIAVNDPEFSPLLGDLSDLPPTLIQVSKDEMLFGDALRYANKARAAQSLVKLEIWPKVVHVFPAFGPDLPEGVRALESSTDFLRSRLTD